MLSEKCEQLGVENQKSDLKLVFEVDPKRNFSQAVPLTMNLTYILGAHSLVVYTHCSPFTTSTSLYASMKVRNFSLSQELEKLNG